MNILITGGAGYIGTALAHTLILQKHQVIIVDNLSLSSKTYVPSAAVFYQLDIRDFEALSRVFEHHQVDVVIHLAALTNPFDSLNDSNEFKSVNIDGTRSVINVCKKNKVNRLIFASSASIYGNLSTDNKNNFAPVSPYAETKLQAEKEILSAKLDTVILRIFNVSGASPQFNLGQNRKTPFHLVDLLAQAALGLKPQISIFGNSFDTPDGTALRDYIHIDDTVQFILRGLQSLLTPGTVEVVNCGSGIGSSVLDVIHKMENVSGQKISYKIENKRPCDPARLVAMDTKNKFTTSDLRKICESAFLWEKSKQQKLQ